jgi:hypothetical protein
MTWLSGGMSGSPGALAGAPCMGGMGGRCGRCHASGGWSAGSGGGSGDGRSMLWSLGQAHARAERRARAGGVRRRVAVGASARRRVGRVRCSGAM